MTNPASTATHPAYIARDTYAGKWITYSRIASRLGNRRAGWLAEHIGDGNIAVIWEYFGTNNAGQMMFARSRFLSCDGRLIGYNSDGALSIIHPADRDVRFLSAAPAK